MSDTAVKDIRDRINATADPTLSEDAAEINLTLKDGRPLTQTVTHATGAPENPLTDAQLEEKFRNTVGELLPPSQLNELLGRLWELERVGNIGDILALCKIPTPTRKH